MFTHYTICFFTFSLFNEELLLDSLQTCENFQFYKSTFNSLTFLKNE